MVPIRILRPFLAYSPGQEINHPHAGQADLLIRMGIAEAIAAVTAKEPTAGSANARTPRARGKAKG